MNMDTVRYMVEQIGINTVGRITADKVIDTVVNLGERSASKGVTKLTDVIGGHIANSGNAVIGASGNVLSNGIGLAAQGTMHGIGYAARAALAGTSAVANALEPAVSAAAKPIEAVVGGYVRSTGLRNLGRRPIYPTPDGLPISSVPSPTGAKAPVRGGTAGPTHYRGKRARVPYRVW